MNLGHHIIRSIPKKLCHPNSTQKRLFYKNYQNALTTHPYTTQAVQTTLLLAIGDVIAQCYVEKTNLSDLDKKRCLKFASLGLFMGPALHRWYFFLDRNIGSSGFQSVFIKVAVDQVVAAPLLQATMLSLIAFMNGYNINGVKAKLEQDFLAVLLTGYKVWPLVQLCNFSIVPLSYRVPVVQVVGIMWNTYMSFKANKPVMK